MQINKLKRRILEISYKYKLSHLGSCLTALPIIYDIFKQKKENDIFVLSSGHAGLALYVILESLGLGNAEDMLIKHGIHPNRDENIFCSTGSLGTGITIGVGAAFASPNKTIYILCSDGETFEGSFWESLCFIQNNQLNNCKIFVNINGFSAYQKVDIGYLTQRLKSFLPSISIWNTNVSKYSFLKEISAHYYVMNEDDYKSTTKEIAIAIPADDTYTCIWELTYDNKNKYCEKYNYDLIRFRGVPEAVSNKGMSWDKIRWLRDELLPKYEYVLLQGVDTLIMNYDIRIEDWIDEQYDWIISRDCHEVNADMILIKNTQWSLDYLDYIHSQYDRYKEHCWKEQKAIIDTYQNHKNNIKVISQQSFNSYWYPYHGHDKNREGNFKEGDWILHFPGLTNEKRLNEMKQWMDNGWAK